MTSTKSCLGVMHSTHPCPRSTSAGFPHSLRPFPPLHLSGSRAIKQEHIDHLACEVIVTHLAHSSRSSEALRRWSCSVSAPKNTPLRVTRYLE